jgi:hypothetical protein
VKLLERFWSKVDKECSEFFDCWEWTGGKTVDGYGLFKLNGRHVLAHRVSYEIEVGKIPDGMLVLHKCDNPSCVNPDHLYTGTNQDNANDRMKRNRTHHKITEEQVVSMRLMHELGYNTMYISNYLEISYSQARRIILKIQRK